MLSFLNIFFTFAHVALTLFNLAGWIWKPTRKAHLITLIITALCWSLLGIWYGWGYCPLTDWHWQVKEKLGERNLPASFIKYFADKITGRDINPSLVDNVTLGCLVFAVAASVYVNFFLKKKKGGLVILSVLLTTTLTAQQPDTAIVWSETKVMWSDFKEKNSYDKYPYKLAKTSWKLKVDITDTCHCDSPEVFVNAAALFFPYSSWVRSSATNNSTLLAHERLHFDIVEFFARQLRKQLSETQFPFKNYKKEIDKIKRKTFSKLQQWQSNYDKETSGGNDIEKQAQWHVSILKEIADLENYKTTTVTLSFKL